MTSIVKLWSRLPVVLRAIVAGLLVLTVGQIPFELMNSANLRRLPAIPWGAAGTAVWLWLYWRWLGGRGWPRSSSATRRTALRAGKLSPRAWRWSLIASGIATLALRMMLDLARRL